MTANFKVECDDPSLKMLFLVAPLHIREKGKLIPLSVNFFLNTGITIPQ